MRVGLIHLATGLASKEPRTIFVSGGNPCEFITIHLSSV
jgi:hypothetical protein